MEHKQKIIEGSTLFGAKRKYTLNLMNAHTGLKLFHEYVAVMVDFLPEIRKILPNIKDVSNSISSEENDTVKIVLNDDLIEVIRLIPAVFTWKRIEELAKEMLACAKVEIDSEILDMGEDGIGDYMCGDPVELYTAIVYGLMANYAPLMESLTADDDDSTLDSGK